jgi:putative endopeptidase
MMRGSLLEIFTMSKPIDRSNLDPDISPAADFYHYSNGGWLKKHPIPDEFSRYGTFDKLREENRKMVHEIIEEVAAGAAATGDPFAELTGSFYSTGMDIDKINSMGIEPVQADLAIIDTLESKETVTNLISTLYTKSIPTLFYLYPSPDRENSGQIIASLHQGGMGLSDVDYYRNDDKRSKEIREKYKAYIARMFVLSAVGEEEAQSYASTILRMESRLAHAGMTRLEQRDPHKTYNKRTQAELADECPAVEWDSLFIELDIDIASHLNVGQPGFFSELSKMINDTGIDEWKVFMKWRLINSAASLLSDDFAETKFDFYGRYLSGKKTMQPRWKRVTAATEDALGEAIGRLFVERYFPPESKARMITLVENLREALRERIRGLEWMSVPTKKKALEKLDRIRVKIGYPDKWRSFEGLSLTNNSYYENYRDAAIFNLRYELAKIGKPADRDEWHMHPHTVNAYYHPLLNEIVFPAGILQPPFFYSDADDAVNYGAIGVVIGHEMTHGFDDQGRKFDKNGNLNDWWTEEDAANFDQRAKVLEDQFNRIRVTGDLYADGKLSLGENIADLGGVNIALLALRKAWDILKPEPEIDGFTPEQRFFLSYAHVWANNIREKEMVRLTKEDVHSLGINRVNGPLPNVESFLKAFEIGEGDKMHLSKEKRASIW